MMCICCFVAISEVNLLYIIINKNCIQLYLMGVYCRKVHPPPPGKMIASLRHWENLRVRHVSDLCILDGAFHTTFQHGIDPCRVRDPLSKPTPFVRDVGWELLTHIRPFHTGRISRENLIDLFTLEKQLPGNSREVAYSREIIIPARE